MDCREALDRLAPLDDGELGPSETELVERHLAVCPACADVRHRMHVAVPRARLAVPADVAARLARLDGAAVARLAEAPGRMARWRAIAVPAPVALGYGALLALAVVWGLANWRERAVLEARLAAATPPAVVAPEIPAEDYRPAAWTPGADEESP